LSRQLRHHRHERTTTVDKEEIVTFCSVACDDCGVCSDADHDAQHFTTREDARQDVAVNGWRVIHAPGPRPADVCDDCKEKPAVPCGRCGRLRGFTEDSGYVWCGCTADLTTPLPAIPKENSWALATFVSKMIGADPSQLTFTGSGGFTTVNRETGVRASVAASSAGTPENPWIWEVYLTAEDGAQGVLAYVHDVPSSTEALTAILRAQQGVSGFLDKTRPRTGQDRHLVAKADETWGTNLPDYIGR
jgi:hypothetical protein